MPTNPARSTPGSNPRRSHPVGATLAKLATGLVLSLALPLTPLSADAAPTAPSAAPTGAAASPAGSASPAPTPIPTATPTPTPSPSATAVPSPTPSPSATAVPSPTPSPSATAVPTAEKGRAKAVSTTDGFVQSGSLVIDATATLTTAHPGWTVTYTMTIENTGADNLYALNASATLPAGLSVRSLGSGGVVSGSTVRWDDEYVFAGQTREFPVTATVDPAATGDLIVSFGLQPYPGVEMSAAHACSDSAARSCVTTTIEPAVPNEPPVARDEQPVDVPNPGSTRLDVLANDSDADGDRLVIEGADASSGRVSVSADRDFLQYEPDEQYRGPARITYRISDLHGGTASAEVPVVVQNAAPKFYWTDRQRVPGDQPTTFTLLDSVLDPNGDTLTLVDELGQPEHGVVRLTDDGRAVYTPDAGYSGDDSFSFTVDDGQGATTTATMLVRVLAVLRAQDDSATTEQGVPTTVEVLANDSASEWAVLKPDTLALVDAAGAPTSVLQVPRVGRYAARDGAITFTPDAAFRGTTVVPYQITEVDTRPQPSFARTTARALVADPRTATADLTITVLAADEPDEPDEPEPTQPTQPTRPEPPVPPSQPTTTGERPAPTGGPTAASVATPVHGPTLASTGASARTDLALAVGVLLAGWGLLILTGRRRRRRG